MATTIPAMKAKFGAIEYFIVTMKAAELVSKLKMPSELPNWEEMEIEERFQRDVNYKRVKDHIAPYLASDPDRFFGAMIVDMYNPEGVRFEPIADVVSKPLPGLYNSSANVLGFLLLEGGEVLVPLDGQHRLAAMRFAIEGKDEKGQPIPNMQANLEIGRDDVTVILIAHDPKRARKIFNKVNRYAKPTSKAENLITADDDIVAVIVRRLINDIIGEHLVNYDSNTLNAKSPAFSTLSTIYEATLEYLQELHGAPIDTTILPDQAKQALFEKNAFELWSVLTSKFTLFEAALATKDQAGDQKRRELRASFLPGKPIAQLSIVLAITRLTAHTEANGARLSLKDAVERLNKLDWAVTNEVWQHVLMTGDKVMSGRTAARFAARMIAYMCGEKIDKDEKEILLEQYKTRFPEAQQSKVKLPSPVV